MTKQCIAIGKRIFSAPIHEPLPRGTVYYFIDLERPEMYYRTHWQEEPEDYLLLERRLIHLTPDAAQTHAMILVEASGGVCK